MIKVLTTGMGETTSDYFIRRAHIPSPQPSPLTVSGRPKGRVLVALGTVRVRQDDITSADRRLRSIGLEHATSRDLGYRRCDAGQARGSGVARPTPSTR